MLKDKASIQSPQGWQTSYCSEVKRFRAPKWAFSLQILFRRSKLRTSNWPIAWRKHTQTYNNTFYSVYIVNSLSLLLFVVELLKISNNWIMYEWHRRLGRKKTRTPNRSRTYDLLVISSHALPLSYRRETRGSLETFKVVSCDKHPAY